MKQENFRDIVDIVEGLVKLEEVLLRINEFSYDFLRKLETFLKKRKDKENLH